MANPGRKSTRYGWNRSLLSYFRFYYSLPLSFAKHKKEFPCVVCSLRERKIKVQGCKNSRS